MLRELPTREEYLAACDIANEYRMQANAFHGGPEAICALRDNPDAGCSVAEYEEYYKAVLEAEKQFNNLLLRNADATTDSWIENEAEFCNYLLEHLAVLKDWGLYNQIRQKCVNADLQPAVDAYEEGL